MDVKQIIITRPTEPTLWKFEARLVDRMKLDAASWKRNTHRPATNSPSQSLDDSRETFERDDALWTDNVYSDVVRSRTLL